MGQHTNIVVALLLLALCAVFSTIVPPALHRLRDPVTLQRAAEKQRMLIGLPHGPQPTPPPYKWTEEYFEHMPISHFSYTDGRKFKLRYFINEDYTVPNGPIFFYTGNEGELEGFATNTGFM